MRATRWQWILLPFMLVSVAGAGILFVTLSHRQFSPIKECDDSAIDLGSVFDRARAERASLVTLRFEVGALLEAKAIAARECHAAYAVRSRMWLRYLAFVTGIALALVGATFIVGQLEIRHTDVGTEGATVKAWLRTSSPGVILVVLGTALMIAALAIKADVQVVDRAVYWTRDLWSGPEVAGRALPDPAAWSEAKR